MKKIRQILSDRTMATILLAIALIIAMGNMCPDKPLGLYPKQYWTLKISWENCADAVITGDSRTLMGVSPEEMQKVLGYKQIKNYAFGANWYCREYLEAVEEIFLPQADKKAVMMGFSPHSLTHRKTVMGGFIELKKRSKQDAFLAVHFGALVNFLNPMSFKDAAHGLIPSLAPTQTQKDFRADGWVAVHKEPLVMDEIKRYRKIFKDRRVSDKITNNVMQFVNKWTSQGIKVYGFITPSCEQMVKVEQELSGFQKEQFISDFIAAGGIWIKVDLYGYESFDGSHLQKEAALQFTRDLSKQIHDIEQQMEKDLN